MECLPAGVRAVTLRSRRAADRLVAGLPASIDGGRMRGAHRPATPRHMRNREGSVIADAMPSFSTRRAMRYSPRQMYDLVADVARYPEFLPLCEALAVRTRTPTPAGEVLTADMTVGYKQFHETFATRVTLQPAEPRIDVAYLDGPFSHLENRWRFLPVPGGGCEVDFFIDYAFKSLVLGVVVGAVFATAFRRFTEAFEDRARIVYGAPGEDLTVAPEHRARPE